MRTTRIVGGGGRAAGCSETDILVDDTILYDTSTIKLEHRVNGLLLYSGSSSEL